MVRRALAVLVIAAASLGCSKSSTPAASANPNDPVEKKLQELAGSGATNCGHFKAQALDQMEAAGKCGMQAAQQKRPFYVAYEMPGMIVALAGTAEGKLFSVQANPSAPGGLASVPCPAELRMAPSGRLTCYAPGTFPMGAGADSHSGMTMPPSMGGSPHPGAAMPAHPNPHQSPPPPPAKQL
ncbi:MAG: hypothetical protein ACHP7J_02445 [Terriglobales bacterium]